MFARLVNEHTKLNKNHLVEGDIYNFNSEGSIDSVGNIQQINLYGSSSVFNKQKWALIVIGERTKILNLYLNFISMFTVSSVISVIITVIGSLLLNRTMTTPVTQMIHRLNSTENKNDIIEFSPTKIAEIDTLGQAIVHLQINVKESASRVSKFMSMVDMGIGVFMYDILDGSVFLSESIIKLLNLPLEPADTTISVDECVKYLNELDPEDKVISNSIFSAHDENKQIKTDIEVICKQIGKRKNVNLKFSLTRENNYIIGLVQDITAAVAEKRRIEFERDYDITTGLLNRRAFYSRLDDIFKTPEVLKTAAVLMIDLDNLKYVNDTYGHDFGDDYIKTAAHIFNDFSDYGGIVARLSGDEFCIFLYGLNSMDDARSIISKIQNKMMESYCILADGTHYKIRASGGISWYPRDAVTYDTLIKYADFAMYTIKHTTKGSIAEFDKDIYNRDSILLTGIEEMNRIIETESIQFAFQSILDARTGQIYGYEILMRPISDLLRAPLEFIRIATAGSKLGEIERLTWLKGLRSFKEKMNDGLISKDCKLFINSLANCELSPQDIELIEDNYSDVLSNIVLELLESEKDNAVFTKNKKQTLKNWNAKFALDDYGSGYNSETVFIKTNPDIIKITRSIISRCDNNEDKKSILKEMVSMAKQMNTIVLAEGVETAEEMRTVIECGVDLIQGYYTNHPSFDIQPVNDEIVQQIKDFYEASQKSKT